MENYHLLGEVMSYGLVLDVTLHSDLTSNRSPTNPADTEAFHVTLMLVDGQAIQERAVTLEEAIEKTHQSFFNYINADRN